MAAIVGKICMEGLWGGRHFAMGGRHFAMIGMKKLQDISDEEYALSSNSNARVLPTLKFFG